MTGEEKEDNRKLYLLYIKYKYLMQKVAYDVLHDHYLAEDAVHNAFLNISKSLGKIEEIEDVKTKKYLIKVVKNAAIDIFRKRQIQIKREIFVDEIREDEMPLTSIDSDIENIVFITLQNMPAKYRDILLLKFSYKLTNKEIAVLLKISQSNVRIRIKRGKELLQKKLNEI